MQKNRNNASPRAKNRKNISLGIAHIYASFNNTLITITDPMGNVIAWDSAGTSGFSGARKSTPYAAQVAAENVAKKAMEHGLKSVEVYLRGPGAGRESSVTTLAAAGLQVISIRDVSSIPHNGCRPPNRRRV